MFRGVETFSPFLTLTSSDFKELAIQILVFSLPKTMTVAKSTPCLQIPIIKFHDHKDQSRKLSTILQIERAVKSKLTHQKEIMSLLSEIHDHINV